MFTAQTKLILHTILWHHLSIILNFIIILRWSHFTKYLYKQFLFKVVFSQYLYQSTLKFTLFLFSSLIFLFSIHLYYFFPISSQNFYIIMDKLLFNTWLTTYFLFWNIQKYSKNSCTNFSFKFSRIHFLLISLYLFIIFTILYLLP